MRHTLLWKEMRELAPVLGVLAALEFLFGLGLWLLPAGALSDGFLVGLCFFASAAVGASLLDRDRRQGRLSLLSSMPIPRGRILAARLAAGLVGVLLVALGGLAVLGLAIGRGWSWTPLPVRGQVMTLLAALAGLGTAALWLRTRSEAVEPWTVRPASWRRAPGLLAIEWRQKRLLLGALALVPLLHLAGVRAGWLDTPSIFGWTWLSGAVAGASLFTPRERDASRCLLHMLPIGRVRLAAGRLLGGLAAGALYLAEYLLVLWIEGDVRTARDLSFVAVVFVFFYGGAFLIGAALSPWLRNTVVTVLLAFISTYLVLFLLMPDRVPIDDAVRLWALTGLALAALAGVAGWSTMRSRAFEPAPRKDLRALLSVLALWLAVAGFLYLS